MQIMLAILSNLGERKYTRVPKVKAAELMHRLYDKNGQGLMFQDEGTSAGRLSEWLLQEISGCAAVHLLLVSKICKINQSWNPIGRIFEG